MNYWLLIKKNYFGNEKIKDHDKLQQNKRTTKLGCPITLIQKINSIKFDVYSSDLYITQKILNKKSFILIKEKGYIFMSQIY